MNNKLSQLIAASHSLTNGYYLGSLFKTKKSNKYRCKVCGDYHTEQSDKKNICAECRKEYLERNGK